MKKITLLIFLLAVGTCNAHKIAVSPPILDFVDQREEFFIINPNYYDIRYKVESMDKDWFSFNEKQGVVGAKGRKSVSVSLKNLDSIPRATTTASFIVKTFQDDDNGFVINPGVVVKAKIRGRKGYKIMVGNQDKPGYDDVIVKDVSGNVKLLFLGGVAVLVVVLLIALLLYKTHT